MILTEALREEMHTLKQFVLMDREDLQKVRKNIASQGTESIDEKQAVTWARGSVRTRL